MSNKPFKLKIAHKGLLLISLPLFMELAILGSLYFMLKESELAVANEARSKQIVATAAELQRELNEMKRALEGMAVSASGFKNDLADKRSKYLNDLNRLEKLVGASDTATSTSIHESSTAALALIDQATKVALTAPAEVVEFRVREVEKELVAIESTLRSRIATLSEHATIEQQHSVLQQVNARNALEFLILTGALLNVAAIIGVTVYFSRNITSRLSVLTDNSFRIASRLPLHPKLVDADEISDLDKTFHWMEKELNELARRDRAMTENAVDVICSIGLEGRFLRVNPACLPVWGYAPDELLGQRYLSIVRENDKEKTTDKMRAAVEDHVPFSYENGVKHKNGGYIEMMWNGGWSDADNAIFLVARDVTERKRIENLKRDFVNLISHDLRTPLTSIQAFMEMLAAGMYDDTMPEMHRKAKYSEADIGRLVSMINSLLELERMEAGHVEIVVERTEVEEIINKAINSVEALAEISNVELKKESCDAVIFADEHALVRVLINLISNAIKFSPSGKPVIVKAIEEHDRIEFQVTDFGRGIAAEFKDQVFDRFKQVEMSDSRVKGGSGLGLAVCKALVEAHGGTIDVLSEEGQGSTFRFFIPISGPAKTESAPKGM